MISWTKLFLGACVALPLSFWVTENHNKMEAGMCYSLERIENHPSSIYQLDLQHIPFVEVPTKVFECTNLTHLYLKGSWLSAKSLRAYQQDSTLNQQDIKQLLEYKIKGLSPKIGQLTALQQFDLSNNLLSNLPSDFEKLQQLRYLDLSGNAFEQLPDVITQLGKLEELQLQDNYIKTLYFYQPDWPNLKTLDLSNNQLESWPLNLCELDELETLNLTNNQLTTLPTQISNYKNLKKLELENNQLQELPTTIGQLKNLESLALRNNALTTLPNSIRQLKKNLKWLDLSGNMLDATTKAQLQKWLPQTQLIF